MHEMCDVDYFYIWCFKLCMKYFKDCFIMHKRNEMLIWLCVKCYGKEMKCEIEY